jgi:hypothetical protein
MTNSSPDLSASADLDWLANLIGDARAAVPMPPESRAASESHQRARRAAVRIHSVAVRRRRERSHLRRRAHVVAAMMNDIVEKLDSLKVNACAMEPTVTEVDHPA